MKTNKISVATAVGRIAFPYLAVPDTGRTTSSGKFSVSMYFPKDSDDWKVGLKALREQVLAVAREGFKNPNIKLSDFQHPFTDTSELETPILPNHIRIVAKSSYAPAVSTPQGTEMSKDDIALIKGGDYARALLTPFYYEYMGKKGVSLGLSVLQFSHKGEALGGGSSAAKITMMGALDVSLGDMTNGHDEEELTPKKTRKPVKQTTVEDTDLLI